MLDSILSNVTETMTGIQITEFLACTAASILMGILASFIYMYKNTYSKNFVITLALLPAIVQLVIMLVNGNIGAGIAVMGAFNLVRFRSVPGSAKDIGSIFFAMAIGLATGMGYVGIAAIFLVCMAFMNIILYKTKFGEREEAEKQVKITVAENMDFEGAFDDLFESYTDSAVLEKIKTTNMGSMFDLTYIVRFKKNISKKEFIDELRVRNGNLNIVCGPVAVNRDAI